MGIFYWEKAFYAGEKSGKMTFPPQKNIPVTPLGISENLEHWNIDITTCSSQNIP